MKTLSRRRAVRSNSFQFTDPLERRMLLAAQVTASSLLGPNYTTSALIQPAAQASVAITGQAQWTDSAGNTHPVPSAYVEIRSTTEADTDPPLATAQTSDSGNYSANINVDVSGGPVMVFARIYARSPIADIKPDTGAGAKTYFMDSTTQTVTGPGSITIPLRTANNTATGEQVFSIHTALVWAGRYANYLMGSTPAKITVLFPTTQATSLFDGTNLNILLKDRWDWDVIDHEYGHYVQDINKFVNSPGGNHSFKVANPKPGGPGLSWSEGFATFFSIMGQITEGESALGVPNVGDTNYTDTEDSTLNLSISTGTGVGELDEYSVLAALYHLAVGDQGITISDKTLFSDFVSAKATTMGAGWDALAASMGGQQRSQIGYVLGQQLIAPVETAPMDSTVPSNTIPTFTWNKNGSNDFIIQFYTSDFKTLIYQTDDLGNVATFTPTADQWSTIFDGHSTVKWVVEGKNTDNPETPGSVPDQTYGGNLDRYWSKAGTINGPSIAIVLDVTGSMSDEIGSVQDALVQYISNLQDDLLPGEDAPTIDLVTFIDNPLEVISSNDLDAVKDAVEAQSAGGGGDCPEPSAQSLQFAAQNIGAGGTILLITDASSDAGSDLDGTIAALRAKGVTVNADISGDCSESVEDTGYGYSYDDAAVASTAKSSSSSSTDCDCNGGDMSDSHTTTESTTTISPASPEITQASGPTIFPFDADSTGEPAQQPIDVPNQATSMDDHGNDAADATALVVDGPIEQGTVGNQVQDANGNPVTDTDDYFSFNLTAGTTYNIPILTPNYGTATATLYQSDGTTQITNMTSTLGDPSYGFMTLTYTPKTSGVYYLDVTSPYSESTDYSIQISDNPLIGATSSFTLFNTAATQTGGEFLYKDAVANDPTADQLTDYQSGIVNIMDSTFEPTVLSATPNLLPAGQTMSVTLTGRDTNWLQGFSNLSFSDSSIHVNSVNVTSATSLTASVTIDAGAALNQFSDATVTTMLGTTTETATGSNVVEVTAAPTSATVLEVTPNILSRGQTQNITVFGVDTAWDSTSTLSLGPGVTISNIQVISPTQITAQATVASSATIGFRVATITTSLQTDTLDRAITVTNTVLSATVPSITSIAPAQDSLGSHVDISVVGANTNFVEGTTTASLGEGITIDSVDVTDATHAIIHADIAQGATLGYRNVTLTTGTETAALLNGFFVSATPAAPVVTGPAAQAVFAGENHTFSLGSFTAGGNGPWNVDVNWGDGSTDTTFSATAVGSLSPQSHTYSATGNYSITITVTNSTDSTNTGGGSGTVAVVNNVGLILTDKTKPSLSISGTLDLTGSGNAYVNSSSATAAAVNGKKASATASLFSIVGKIKKGSKFTGTTKTSQAAITDPLLGLAAPPKPATVSSKADKIKSSTPTTIQPGTYIGGINDSGTGTLTLAPGIYYLQGGGFTVGAKSTVTGTGVTIYLVGKGSINLSGTLTLTPAITGAYAGIVFFQDRSDASAIKINGHTTINGIFYAPDAKITIGSKAHLTDNPDAADSIDALSIFSDITISAGGTLTIDTADNIPTAVLT